MDELACEILKQNHIERAPILSIGQTDLKFQTLEVNNKNVQQEMKFEPNVVLRWTPTGSMGTHSPGNPYLIKLYLQLGIR